MQAASAATLDRIFSALADPTRRAMLVRLANSGASIGELGQPFGLTKPAITKHVRVLERAGLIRRDVDPDDRRIMRMTASREAMRTARAWMEHHRKFWNDRLDVLEEHLVRPRS